MLTRTITLFPLSIVACKDAPAAIKLDSDPELVEVLSDMVAAGEIKEFLECAKENNCFPKGKWDREAHDPEDPHWDCAFIVPTDLNVSRRQARGVPDRVRARFSRASFSVQS